MTLARPDGMAAEYLRRPPARCITPALVEWQLTLLADWAVQTRDDRVYAAAHALGVRERDFDALCEAWERIVDIDDGIHEIGPWDDPDQIDAQAREGFEYMLDVALGRSR